MSSSNARMKSVPRVLVALSFGVLAVVASGCGGEGADTSCTTSDCTITFDRGVDGANVSILGIDAKLDDVQNDKVTLTVAGQQVTAPVGGDAQAGDFTASVQDVTKNKVVVKVSR